MNRLPVLPRADYDKSVRIDGLSLSCYSKKKFKEVTGDRPYRLVGETCKNNLKDCIAHLSVTEQSVLRVSSCERAHNRLLYARVGYVSVGEDSYVLLLKSRLAFLILLLLFLAAIGAAVGILLSMLQPEAPVVSPNNPLPDPDPDVRPLPPSDEPAPDVSTEGGKVSMIYSLSAKMQRSTGEITILFKNPTASNHDVMLEMYVPYADGDIKIAQSGRIPAGNGLYTLDFIPSSAVMGEGVYSAYYKVIYYDPVSGERALVESKIEDLALEVRS